MIKKVNNKRQLLTAFTMSLLLCLALITCLECEGTQVYSASSTEYTVSFNIVDGYSVIYGTAPDNINTAVLNGGQVKASGTLYISVTGTGARVYRGVEEISITNGYYPIDNIEANTTIDVCQLIDLNISYGAIKIGDEVASDRVYTYYDSSSVKQSGIHNAINRYRVTGTSGTREDGGTHNVELVGIGDFNVILHNANIYMGNKVDIVAGIHGAGIGAPLSTSSVTSGVIRVYLSGENTLCNMSPNTSSSYAGLDKSDNPSTLEIWGDGTLTAIGGADSAGIGGSDLVGGATNNISIYDGTIYASNVGSQGAGIGSGNNQYAYGIRIYGGNISAVGSENGAGIGGSGGVTACGADGQVYIYGGTVVARSSGNGAAIGAGGSNTAQAGSSYVNISGGNITADSIGGGSSNTTQGGNTTVIISGGVVNVEGNLGIHGGNSGTTDGGTIDITISGGTVTAHTISGGTGTSGTATGTLTVTGGSVDVDEMPATTTASNGGEILVQRAITIPEITAVTLVTNVIITESDGTTQYVYGSAMYTDETGTLYLFIPESCIVKQVTISENGVETGIPILTNEAMFTITIPETINMTTGDSFNIQGVRSNLAGSQEVIVSCSGDFQLELTGATDNKLAYMLYTDAQKQSAVTNNGTVATFVGSGTNTAIIYYAITGTPIYSGEYTDTLTFTVSIS